MAEGSAHESFAIRFPTTSWTMISAAGNWSDGSRQALSHLCEAYWLPVYGFIRRKGHGREAAEDLTQEFFTRLIERGSLAAAQRDRGRFRSFLLASVSNFLANEWDRSNALKRGAGATLLALDFESGEARYSGGSRQNLAPDALFEQQWALTLLDRILARLGDEYAREGRRSYFERMRVFLTGDQDRGSYEQVAADLKLTEGAARTAVHRLRRRFGEALREEIAALVGGPEEVEGEIRFLLAALEHE